MTSSDHQLALTAIDAPSRSRPARPWARWLAPRPFDWVSSFLYLSALVVFIGGQLSAPTGGTFLWPQALAAVVLTAALLGIDRWEDWRYGAEPPRRVAALLLALRVVLIEALLQMYGFGVSVFLYVLLPYTAAQIFGSLGGWLMGGLVWAAFTAKLAAYKTDWHVGATAIDNLIIFTLMIIFVVAMSKLVAQERRSRAHAEKLLAELEISHRQLTAYAAQAADLATMAERNRLAREIHDSLGHYLTVINVQLEKALAFRARQPHEADQAVAESKRLARAALDDVRHSVGMLRTPQVFGLGSALEQLSAPLRSGPLHVTLTVEGSEAGFGRQALLALYRAAQEGLTNIQRHARAGHAQLALHFTADTAQLTLTDDGVGFDTARLRDRTPGQQGGYGLLGLQERLELVGGTLELSSAPGHGTRLVATAPRGALHRPAGAHEAARR